MRHPAALCSRHPCSVDSSPATGSRARLQERFERVRMISEAAGLVSPGTRHLRNTAYQWVGKLRLPMTVAVCCLPLAARASGPLTSSTSVNSPSPSSQNPNPVILTADVTFLGPSGGVDTGPPPTPTGSVTFSVGSSTGNANYGPVPLSNGIATAGETLPLGSAIVSATYSGDSNYQPSTSSSVAFQVSSGGGVNSPTLPQWAAIGMGSVLILTSWSTMRKRWSAAQP